MLRKEGKILLIVLRIVACILSLSLLTQPVYASLISAFPNAEQFEETSKTEEKTEAYSHQRRATPALKPLLLATTARQTISLEHSIPQPVFALTKRFLVLQVFRL
ncbi:MAG: hypothetical protein HRU69_06015 [Flammeovirgaceae bacterium]|nr:MAG: hypothetical protein HRU69_06015 [Flammeovirgaceae bacterium]